MSKKELISHTNSPLDRMKRSNLKVVIAPDKKGKVVRYNWIQRLIIKLFRL